MTPLDAALKAAQTDPAKRNDYYTLFLNSEIFIPTVEQAGQQGMRRAGPQEKFYPVVVSQDGKEFVPVFDSLERLQAWIQRPMPFISAAAHALVEALGSRRHLALNPGTPFYKEFVSEELDWLLGVLRSQRPQQTTVPQGTEVMIGAPKQLPPQLTERIAQALRKSPEVTAAYLPQILYGGPNARPQLLLLLRADGADETTFEAIVKDVTFAMRGLLGPDQFVDIVKYTGSGLDKAVLEMVKPFYGT